MSQAEVEVAEEKPKGFLADVCAYFRDFLETDFKRQQFPKRQVAAKDGAGNLTGVPLGRYPTAIRDLYAELVQATGNDLRLKFALGPGQHRSSLRETLKEVIAAEVAQIDDERTGAVAETIQLRARRIRENYLNDPEGFQDEILEELRADFIRTIAVPTMKRLETYFDTHTTDGFEVAYSAEDEIGDRLIEGSGGAIATGLASALIKNDFSQFDTVVEEITKAAIVRDKLTQYFEGFASSDLFRDVHDLLATTKLRDNLDLYLYIGELRFKKVPFPLFYLPLEYKTENQILRLVAGPRIYINKRALEFAAQEISRETGRALSVTVRDTYLEFKPGVSPVSLMQELANKWCVELALAPILNIETPLTNKASRSSISISNMLSFAAFDKSDEALVNDYESIMRLLKAGGDIAEDFANIVTGIIDRNATSIISVVEGVWDSTPIPARLVYESPVPLNEEQRKIMSAISDSRSRFISIEGPPGTGKSHTISAIAFDAILSGKNVLILSDKKEALDVVESKIGSVLKSVREGDDFKNPILRLGTSGSTYGEIVKPASITAIRNHHAATRSQRDQMSKGLARDTEILTSKIENTIRVGGEMDLDEIAAISAKENGLREKLGDRMPDFEDQGAVKFLANAWNLASTVKANDGALAKILHAVDQKATVSDLDDLVEHQQTLSKYALLPRDCAELFNCWRGEHLAALQEIIRAYENLKWPIFGFLFVGAKARELDARASQTLPLTDALDLHKRLETLKRAYASFAGITSYLKSKMIEGRSFDFAATQLVLGLSPVTSETVTTQRYAVEFGEQLQNFRKLASSLGISDKVLEWAVRGKGQQSEFVLQALELAARFDSVRAHMDAMPVFDYATEKARLQNLHAGRLASKIDEHVLDFAENRQNDLSSIREIIKLKQRFPEEMFGALKSAFPCIIAGIRDYAEFMPLAKGIFDLVIIDEASQVSIAQALPAFIRAKKVVVLGDRNQFSNVKTVNASNETNILYANRIIQSFINDNGAMNAAQEERVKLFNIKTNVLRFVERIADYRLMLRKHFRGYPELIAFSSRIFYNGQLQPMKIRGRPISEVIVFNHVENATGGALRNVNDAEAKAILAELKSLADVEKPPTVGVITPFTEQQSYISQIVNKSEGGRGLINKLDLKIMTFDTCQGEERDIILYSMVATRDKDRLAYIFPSVLSQSDSVDSVLRLQRLNVGFSRAKETVKIYHSKPLAEFSGAIGDAIRFFAEEKVRAESAPSGADTDPASPMEKKVLHWLKQTKFFTETHGIVEINAQFRVGEYLKQIDPTYRHPAYRADFLVKINTPGKSVSIIVEYDGFKEHFNDTSNVTAQNFGAYYKPEDVERQKVLESYGYRFLRINRFNIGKDPVALLDRRLAELTKDVLTASSTHPLVDAVKETVNEIETGDRKVCPKCKTDRKITDFRAPGTKSGQARYCRSCRSTA